MDRTSLRERYLHDNLPVRLGGLAANLRRIGSFSHHPANGDAVASQVDESKYFIEWTAAEAEVETAAQLVELQVQLARWQQARYMRCRAEGCRFHLLVCGSGEFALMHVLAAGVRLTLQHCHLI